MNPSREIRYLCHGCIGNRILKAEIKKEGSAARCYHCGKRRKSVDLEIVAERVDEKYREYCIPQGELDDAIGDHPENIVAEMLESDIELAEAIVECLSKKHFLAVHKDGEDDYYDSTSTYAFGDIGDNDYYELWDLFCYEVKHAARWYDSRAAGFLDEIFEGISNYPSIDKNEPLRVIKPGDPDSHIYRSRKADDDQSRIRICMAPHRELGPPPGSMAKPNRMNPAGISVFYGSFDRETCVSELRLPVGGTAVTGEFITSRPIMVLDFPALNDLLNTYSVFDPNYNRRLQQMNFFSRLESEIRKPILPNDEMLDYIPTQALAEYLSKHFTPHLDGVIFSSVQAKEGRNIVLFNHASRIASPQNEISSNSQNQEYDLMWLDGSLDIMQKPKAMGKELSSSPFSMDNLYSLAKEMDNREPMLSYIQDSIQIHSVLSVDLSLKTRQVNFIGGED